MENIQELYNKYAGKSAKINDNVGIICGYSKPSLIMAVTKGRGWCDVSDMRNTIITELNNELGYAYCDELNIIK